MLRSIRQPLLAVAFVGTLVAVPALAQPAASYPPACDASKVSRGDVDRAHTVFLSGKQFLDESNYDKAISYFTDAYSIDCSVHAILPIIATAYERKGDKAEAVRALEEYLRRVPTSSDREHIERRIKNLNDQMAREQPSAAVPAASTASTTAPAAVPPPEASATAVPTSPMPLAQTVEVPTAQSGHGIGPWVLGGIGGAAAITGIVMYAVGASDISSAESTCPTHVCKSASVTSQGNSGLTLERVGVIAGAAGLATLGAGLVWLLVEKPAAAPTSGTFVTPVVALGYAGISLGSSL